MTDTHRVDGTDSTRERELLTFAVMDSADAQARVVIGEQLDRYNAQQTGGWDNEPLDVIIRDGAGRVVGGLVGRTSLGVLFVDYLVVPDELRGRGAGSRALALAEEEAIRRGCVSAALFTMVVQAPGFYEKRGYEAFGRIECRPPGNARIFMRKALLLER